MQKEGEESRSKNVYEPYTFDFLDKNDPPTRADFLKTIAKELAHIRRTFGLTQDKLNYRLGIADRLLNKWECGDKTPSGFNLYCWADALNERLITAPKEVASATFILKDGSKIEREFIENAEDVTK